MEKKYEDMLNNAVYRMNKIFNTERILDLCVICGDDMTLVTEPYGRDHYRQCFICMHREYDI